ncbi:MAG: hypothetical protein HC930_17425 [Hydrococcus sp. SU_1_0]|nr:hypothetical protein [Hydrococcus sp. SU_1_0]
MWFWIANRPNTYYPWTIKTNGRVLGLRSRQDNLRNKYQTNPNGTCNTRILLGQTWQLFSYLAWVGQTNPNSQGGIIYFDEKWLGNFESQTSGKEVVIIDSITRLDGLPDNCGDWTFTITKNGKSVHQESRSVKPEVQKIPCQLSDVSKQIEIEKFPYLERVEVIPWAYQNFGANVYRNNIPSNCLNIYKGHTTAIIPLPGGIPTPSNSSIDQDYSYGFITQICSAPGCPPPEYDVICDCNNCESCPGDTCGIECNGVICCYNDYGTSIKEIAKSNYCGGQA